MIDTLLTAGKAAAERLRSLDVVALWARATEREIAVDPFQRDVAFLRWLLPLMETFARYFDGKVEGLEHVPESGPVLLVGNHSGGAITPDTSVFLSAWYDRFGLDRPLFALALDAAFGLPGFRTLMRKIGEIPASRANAQRALAEGYAVLVYPGGEHEIFRPWSERNRVDLNGRRGFIELALRARAPVVPVVSHGGHDSTIILTRGEWLGERLGLERIRTHGLPLALQIPWGLSPVSLPGLPLPAQITVRVLPPMRWQSLGPEAADDPAVVRRCYDEITAAMQAALSELAAEHPMPVLSRLRRALSFSPPRASRASDASDRPPGASAAFPGAS